MTDAPTLTTSSASARLGGPGSVSGHVAGNSSTATTRARLAGHRPRHAPRRPRRSVSPQGGPRRRSSASRGRGWLGCVGAGPRASGVSGRSWPVIGTLRPCCSARATPRCSSAGRGWRWSGHARPPAMGWVWPRSWATTWPGPGWSWSRASAPGIDAAAHAGALRRCDDGADCRGPGYRARRRHGQVAGGAAPGDRDPRRVLSEIPPGAPERPVVVRRAQPDVGCPGPCRGRGGVPPRRGFPPYRLRGTGPGGDGGAVPGSVRSPASAGTNRLLVEGAVPIRDVDDVLTAVELAVAALPDITPPSRPAARSPGLAAAPPASAWARGRAGSPRRSTMTRHARGRGGPSGLPLGDVSLALEQLAEAGLAVGEQGWWCRPHP